MERRVAVNFRLPEELYTQLKEIAGDEDRSLNAQVVRFLREAVGRYRADRERPDQPSR
jgi:hypothetical protein